MTQATFPSPAKINLNLHIVGRRNDGYHLLQSYFQILDFGDTMRFEVADDNITLLTPFEGVTHDDNLIVKAANLLKHKAQDERLGVKIEIDKQLPMGGGLGGGSSNAATTLLALNKLWGLNYNRDELAQIGLTLGADVPIFVRGYSAWGEGIGDQLTPVENKSKWYVVLRPPVEVSTASVFQHPELTRDTPSYTVATVLAGGGRNDCEPIVRSLYKEVDDGLKWLSQFGEAKLTGTGSCIFAEFDDRDTANRVLNCKPQRFDGFVAKGVFSSPINDML